MTKNVYDFMTQEERSDFNCDSFLDHTAAIGRAMASMPKGGILHYPAGTYNVTGAIATNVCGLTHQGEGKDATKIIQKSPTSDTFVFNSTQYSGVKGMTITNATKPTAGWAVRFMKTGQYGCFFSFAEDLLLIDGFNGVEISSSTESRVSKIHLRRPYGTNGVKIGGTNYGDSGSFRAVLEDIVGDTVDNGNKDIVWYNQDSYSYSLVINKCTGLNGGKLFTQTDTVNKPDSAPMWCYAWDFEGDHNHNNSIELIAGEGFVMSGSWIGSSIRGGGIVVAGSHKGEIDVSTTRIMGNYHNGILVQGGPVEVSIHDNQIGANSQIGAGQCHGVIMGSNASRFRVRDNRIGSLASGGASQGYGVFVMGGASSDYHITGNGVSGNLSGGIMNGAPSPTSVVSGNI